MIHIHFRKHKESYKRNSKNHLNPAESESVCHLDMSNSLQRHGL